MNRNLFERPKRWKDEKKKKPQIQARGNIGFEVLVKCMLCGKNDGGGGILL
jgi:hypothetical protein